MGGAVAWSAKSASEIWLLHHTYIYIECLQNVICSSLQRSFMFVSEIWGMIDDGTEKHETQGSLAFSC